MKLGQYIHAVSDAPFLQQGTSPILEAEMILILKMMICVHWGAAVSTEVGHRGAMLG